MTRVEEKKRPFSRLRRKDLGILGRLFSYFTIFIFFVLFLIWLFQIHLLGVFYEATKYEELNLTAEELSHFLDDKDSLSTAVSDYASRYGICISVYRHGEHGIEEFLRSHVAGACAVHQFSESDCADLYARAIANAGPLSVKYDVERQFIEWNHETEDLDRPQDGESDTSAEEPLPPPYDNIVVEESVNAVAVHIEENSAGEQYILMIDSKLTPVSSLIETLELQFFWLAVILLILALSLALLLSHLISRPIVSMNRSARRLAKGDYGETFVGAGFRETRELAETLNYAAEELSKNDLLQKDLIANISHDLRTPLTMIKGYSEVMRDLPGENTPENMQVVIDETERMSELVSDLLDLSRIQAGHRVPMPQVLDLCALVEKTLARYDKLMRYDGFDITFEGRATAYVSADDTMLLQALYNLINNAVNFTGADNVVRVVETIEEGRVRISISDTGAGIPKEHLSMIWDRYYKVDRVRRRTTVGTGLGLSIVREVLELHSASYGVESEEGKGTTFWLSLPTVNPPSEHPLSPSAVYEEE